MQPPKEFKPDDPEIFKITNRYDSNRESLLDMLTEIQNTRGWVSNETIQQISHLLRIPNHQTFGVASFFSMINIEPQHNHIMYVCDGPACWLAGSNELLISAQSLANKQPNLGVKRSSCLGLCDCAPAVLLDGHQAGPDDAHNPEMLLSGWRGQQRLYNSPRSGEVRVMMEKAGLINPDSINSAITEGAYQALSLCVNNSPEKVLDEIEESGLTGRGGAGFPVGRKWKFVAREKKHPKYIICNADESEPLVFKDRILIDTNPHQIVEGMAIAGFATGADKGFIYIRGEYSSQANRLQNAILQAESEGYLGNNILGSGFNFSIDVHRGAGAYICGEETALIESLQGHRGEPRLRPPFPPQFGYHGLPTLVNNVESFASVPAIVRKGSQWYRNISSYTTPGTKLYILLGNVNQPGLFEAPFGLTLREMIENFGGGMSEGSKFHFALCGGAAGTIASETLLDIPIDYASSTKGVSLGAGAFLICDQNVSPVALLRELFHFFKAESCGKCTPCRTGTYRTFSILERLASGQGNPNDLVEMDSLSQILHDSSFCGLGQSASLPLRTALAQFEGSFRERIQ